ncbi:hypothetical protein D3C85_1300100 [compost metagenome]
MTQATQQLQAVQLGKGDIQQDQVGLRIPRQRQATDARFGRTDDVHFFLLQEHLHGQPGHGLVVYQQCLAHINQLHRVLKASSFSVV